MSELQATIKALDGYLVFETLAQESKDNVATLSIDNPELIGQVIHNTYKHLGISKEALELLGSVRVSEENEKGCINFFEAEGLKHFAWMGAPNSIFKALGCDVHALHAGRGFTVPAEGEYVPVENIFSEGEAEALRSAIERIEDMDGEDEIVNGDWRDIDTLPTAAKLGTFWAATNDCVFLYKGAPAELDLLNQGDIEYWQPIEVPSAPWETDDDELSPEVEDLVAKIEQDALEDIAKELECGRELEAVLALIKDAPKKVQAFLSYAITDVMTNSEEESLDLEFDAYQASKEMLAAIIVAEQEEAEG